MGATKRQIERIYRSRYPGFVAAVTASVGNPEDAAEIVQDGFAQALVRRDDFRGEGALEAWIWKIVLRRAVDQLAGRRTVVPLDDRLELGLPDQETDPELASALRALPPRKRLVVFLHYLADLPYSTVAEICGISEGTVAATLAQARAALARSLSETDLHVAAATRRER